MYSGASFCRLLFKNVLLRAGITISIHFRVNDPGWCWYRRLLVTYYFIILFDPHLSPQLGEYKMQLRSCICRQFPWHCVRQLCQGRDGWRNFRQKRRIGSLLIGSSCRVWTVLFRLSGWQLICGPITSTITTLFKMPQLLIIQFYIMLCQQIMK